MSIGLSWCATYPIRDLSGLVSAVARCVLSAWCNREMSGSLYDTGAWRYSKEYDKFCSSIRYKEFRVMR